MPDPEPSDPSIVHPVNRIALVSPSGLHESLGASPPAGTADSSGLVVDLDEPQGLGDIVPELARTARPEFDGLVVRLNRESAYRLWYDLARCSIDAGEERRQVRNQFLEMADATGDVRDVVREAIEDAVADRPPKFDHPFGA